jgi:hypothetical protein
MAEIDRQRGVIARQQMEIDSLVAWAANDFDALMFLQSVYRNPNTPEGRRVDAAKAAMNRELPKTINNVVNFSLFKHLEEAKTIEHQPRLDLEGPTPPTILGHDGGPEPAA